MLLALKLVLVPLLIGAITVAGRRLGPRVAGALTGLPVVAGPVVLFLALEQGAPFAARSAAASLAGVASVGAFCVLYAGVCLRLPWWTSVVIGWAGFAASTLALEHLAPPLPAAAALAAATPLVVRAATPQPALPARIPAFPRREIALRMAAGAALLLVVTRLSGGLGPRLAGLLTVFPVATAVLAASSHRSQGAPFAVHLLRGLAVGLYSVGAFFLTLAFALDRLGTAGAFALAVAACLAAQLAVQRALARPPR